MHRLAVQSWNSHPSRGENSEENHGGGPPVPEQLEHSRQMVMTATVYRRDRGLIQSDDVLPSSATVLDIG